MDDCIFCKIVNGEMPSLKVYEDDYVLAFLDIMPLNPGHTLIIPKKHYEFITDIPDDDMGYIFKAIKKIATALRQGLNADGYNVLNNNGKVAGQLVSHAHFHIIPKFENDGWKFNWPAKNYEEGQDKKILAKILEHIN